MVLGVLLGADEVDVSLATTWDAYVMLARVLSNFLSSGKVGHRLVAWNCYPHSEHGTLTHMVGVLVMMGDLNCC